MEEMEISQVALNGEILKIIVKLTDLAQGTAENTKMLGERLAETVRQGIELKEEVINLKQITLLLEERIKTLEKEAKNGEETLGTESIHA